MGRKETARRIAKGSFELVLMEIPVFGWGFLAYFAWRDRRASRRKVP